MHPSKVTLRPKVRRPMAWDSTKSAPSAQQPDPSTQCPIPGGYRRAETRHHRIDHPARLREDAQQPDMIAAIPFATAHCAQQPDASDAIPLATAHRAQKLDTIQSITRICCALRAETRPHRGRYSTRFVERIRMSKRLMFWVVSYRDVRGSLSGSRAFRR